MVLKYFGKDNRKRYLEALRDIKHDDIKMLKIWEISVWKEKRKHKTCEKHLPYAKLGYVDMDYKYAPNLKFPFDPDCQNPEEFNN